jgi:DNA gyrase subunit A
LATRYGKAIRFNEGDVRIMGRTATGVKGITMKEPDNYLVGMVCVSPTDELATILVLSENGIGKRTVLDAYRVQSRGGKGTKTINVTEKTGLLVAMKSATENDDLVIINKSGLTIRLAVNTVPTSGRATQGVKLISLKKKDAIADVGLIKDGQLESENDGDNEDSLEATENTDNQATSTNEEE